MNRTNFYTIVRNDSTDEFDYLYNNLSKFQTKYAVAYYRVEERDLMRPDLISYKLYGTIVYWWLILMLNGVQNPLKDLEVGMLLKIPSALDIYDFQQQWAIR